MDIQYYDLVKVKSLLPILGCLLLLTFISIILSSVAISKANENDSSSSTQTSTTEPKLYSSNAFLVLLELMLFCSTEISFKQTNFVCCSSKKKLW
jgi:hypothetical protein